jgi:hypothetical protein
VSDDSADEGRDLEFEGTRTRIGVQDASKSRDVLAGLVRDITC